MDDLQDGRAGGSARSEFRRLLRGHVNDIRALAVYYGREDGDDPALGRLLMEAAEDIRETAFSLPSKPGVARKRDTAKVVPISAGERHSSGDDSTCVPF